MGPHTIGYRGRTYADTQGTRQWRLPLWIIEHNRAYLRTDGVDAHSATKAQLRVLRGVPGMPMKLLNTIVVDLMIKAQLFTDMEELSYRVKGIVPGVADNMPDNVRFIKAVPASSSQ